MAEDLEIDGLLHEEGFDTPEARSEARRCLQTAKLTNPGKSRIHRSKIDTVNHLLLNSLFRVCSDAECLEMAKALAQGRTVVHVSAQCCQVCRGSDNCRDVTRLNRCLEKCGKLYVIIVGGTPTEHREIRALSRDSQVKYRFIDATKGNYDKTYIKAQSRKADMVIVWGSTPLPHKVSNIYKDVVPSGRRISVARRGISQMCRETIQSLLDAASRAPNRRR